MPAYLAAKLSCILFSTLVHVKDMAKFSSFQLFSLLIQDLNTHIHLSTKGIKVTVNDVVKTVNLQCILVLGDNLGLSCLFNLVNNFNCNYCCRICKATLQQIHTLEEEDPSLMRNPENYKENLEKK